MIVDFHFHFPTQKITESEAVSRAQSQIPVWYRSGRIKIEKSLGEMAKDRVNISDDPDGAKLLKRMEEAGIDLTVLLALDIDYKGVNDSAIMAANKFCADLAKKSPKKFIAFASIHPNRRNAPERFRECIKEYGMRGLKWHPALGAFDPTSPKRTRCSRLPKNLRFPC